MAELSAPKYKGTLKIGSDGKSTFASHFDSALKKSGKAYLDFEGGDFASATVGVKDLKLQEKLSGSVNWTPSSKTGKLELKCTAIEKVDIFVSPTLPLPADLNKIPIKLVTSHKLTSPAVDTKLTLFPLESKGTLEVIKKLDSKLCSEARITIDSAKKEAKVELKTPTTNKYDMDHFLEFVIVHAVGGSAPTTTGNCLYTAKVNKELSAKLKVNLKADKSFVGEAIASYKLGDNVSGLAKLPITALSAQGLGKPTFEIVTTYDF